MSWSTQSGQSADTALAQFANGVRGRAPHAIDALSVAFKAEIQRQLSTPGMGRYYAKLAVDGRSNVGPFRGRKRVGPLTKSQARAETLNNARVTTAERLNRGEQALASIRRKDVLTGLHRASKPGDPPAPDTGTLKRSAFVERVASGARVGVAMLYGRYLEFGTSRMQPRPFMRPSLLAIRARFGDVVRATLRTGSTP